MNNETIQKILEACLESDIQKSDMEQCGSENFLVYLFHISLDNYNTEVIIKQSVQTGNVVVVHKGQSAAFYRDQEVYPQPDSEINRLFSRLFRKVLLWANKKKRALSAAAEAVA